MRLTKDERASLRSMLETLELAERYLMDAKSFIARKVESKGGIVFSNPDTETRFIILDKEITVLRNLRQGTMELAQFIKGH